MRTVKAQAFDRHYLTEEGENQAGIPWNEYPRPQLKRDSFLNLNGYWDYAVSLSGRIPSGFPYKIQVPFPPESILSGIGRGPRINQFLYYRRKFRLPENFHKNRVLLHFGAVDQMAVVWINGNKVTTHAGGYLPFSVDITEHLKDSNTVIVKVRDNLDRELPYGKQKRKRGGMWYTPVSGIWQTVWLESVPLDYIRNIKITPSLQDVEINTEGGIRNKTLRIMTSEGEVVRQFTGNSIRVSIDDPVHWSPENPYLYRFSLESGSDRIESYFALRTLSIEGKNGKKRLCLNGKPYFFHGLLDQGYYSDGIYLPASVNGYRRDIETMKDLGFNTLRKHIKIEPAWYYYLCDSLGMVVFQDMVNNGTYHYLRDTIKPTFGMTMRDDTKFVRQKRGKNNFTAHMKVTIKHLYNFPSICYWTIFNEGWGQFDSDVQYHILRKEDSTRFVDSTSGWFWQKKSDVDSYHIYFRPLKAKIADRPLVISEFGGYSCRISGHSYHQNQNYGYRFFADKEKLQKALWNLYLKEVVPLKKKGLSAAIYTQVSDVEEEINGLVTYDRKVLKADPDQMRKIAAILLKEQDENRE